MVSIPIMEQIRALLAEGKPAKEIILLGFKSSTVYRVQRQLRRRATTRSIAEHGANAVDTQGYGASSGGDPDVEAHPEIIELKRKLRKAQLERQLREVRSPLDIESNLRVVYERVESIEGQLTSSPLIGLGENFECSGCGAEGMVAASIICTNCRRETHFGWWPDRKTL